MRASQRSRAKYPLATISAYGPDNRRATKLVVGILRRPGQKDANPMRSWSTDASDVRNDPVIAAELADWLRSQGIKDTVTYDRIIGCPHEEGIDYPIGRTCPQCPFWASIDRFTRVTHPDTASEEEAQLFCYALYLLAKWRETRAYPGWRVR